jgi:3',5'-cyclic-AMP phosphodiesterase
MTLRFGLISDAHFGPPTSHRGRLRKLGPEASELTRAFVREMNDEFRPDVVVNLGDVVEDESLEADSARYQEFLRCLDDLDAPVLHVAGNHESVHLDDDALGALWGRTGPLYYSQDVGDFRFVVLRTVQYATHIELPGEQLAWLAEELRRPGPPIILLAHHPLSDQRLEGNRWFEDQPHLCRVANRREVRRLVEETRRVIAVFNGHVHWNHVDVIGGRPYFTIQSLIENVLDDAPGLAARAWGRVVVTPRRLHVDIRGAEPVRVQFELDAGAP